MVDFKYGEMHGAWERGGKKEWEKVLARKVLSFSEGEKAKVRKETDGKKSGEERVRKTAIEKKRGQKSKNSLRKIERRQTEPDLKLTWK